MSTELETAIELVHDLIGALDNLPCTWEEFVGEDLADRVHDFLGDKDDPEDEEEA